MDNPVYPYGPSPNKLEKLVSSLVKQKERQVSLDLLERLGVPKTQVSIALSGLKQFGFIDSTGGLTPLSKMFANLSTRKQASQQIIQDLYGSLTDVVEKNPASAQIAVSTFLQRLGRGESAREKILKLFWYFWKLAGKSLSEPEMKITEQEVATQTERIRVNGVGEEVVAIPKNSEVTGVTLDADPAAIQLANSLISFCDLRGKILAEKKTQIATLQKECSQLEEELGRVKKVLDQHIAMYPGLTSLLKI